MTKQEDPPPCWPSQYCEHLDGLEGARGARAEAMADVPRDARKTRHSPQLLVTLAGAVESGPPQAASASPRSGGRDDCSRLVTCTRGPLLEDVSDVLKITGIWDRLRGLGQRLHRLFSDLRLVGGRSRRDRTAVDFCSGVRSLAGSKRAHICKKRYKSQRPLHPTRPDADSRRSMQTSGIPYRDDRIPEIQAPYDLPRD